MGHPGNHNGYEPEAPELVVLLDGAGEPIGVADKHTVHGADTPYHLAFSCYAFRADGRLLVTQRSWEKRTWPGIWTNSCCGHPAPGERTADAVKRRLGQELGLRAHDLRLTLPFFSYRAELDGVVEHELCPVFLCRIDDAPRPNPGEVADFSWWTWERFVAEAAAEDGQLSPWARLQTRELDADQLVASYLDDTTAPSGGEWPRVRA